VEWANRLPTVTSRAGACSGGSGWRIGEQTADSDKSSRRLVGGMGEQAADSDKSSRRLLRRIGLADWVGGLGWRIGEQTADSDKSSRRLLRRIGFVDRREDCRQ
jgi:hypothetical protein